MAELRIHQEQLDEDSIRQLIDICPFGAISCRDVQDCLVYVSSSFKSEAKRS